VAKKKKKQNSRVGELAKIDYILSILEKFEYSQEEANQVISSFIDTKLSKITEAKIKNRLQYIRVKEKIKIIEDTLMVTFNLSSEMEFYHSYEFNIAGEVFNKSLLTTTKMVSKNSLDNIDKLIELKAEAINKKTTEVANFLKLINGRKHLYLRDSEILELTRKMEPTDSLYNIEIPLSILTRIINTIDSSYLVSIENENIEVSQEKSYILYEKELPYTIKAIYKKGVLYNLIWQEKKLPIVSDITYIDTQIREDFNKSIKGIESRLKELSKGLEIDPVVYQKYILQFIEPQIISSKSLWIKEKIKKRIYYHFLEYIQPLKEKKRKEELLAKTIRDFKSLFPLARGLHREIIFHVGATNSGKTYQALKHLKEAETGYYLAPLRLLALEGYESLKKDGVNVSLITGEEEIIDEESTHVSSTIEMMNSSVEVDIAVIDEIQMIDDRDRGWAWANALIGVPAKKVILTGSIDVLDAIQKLSQYLNEPLKIIHFHRKNELRLLSTPTPITAIEKGSAIVAFSRREVLALRQQLSKDYRVSVVYGNLSPEVRREEARRFREGKSDILIATDAIAMGLNLPIKTIIFSTDNKFDGLRRRELLTSEVTQISGRAGRYGFEEIGYIGAIDKNILNTIKSKLNTKPKNIDLPFSVMASLEHVILIGEILETDNLSTILTFFANNMEFEGPFVAGNIDSMLEIASIVDRYNLNLKTKYFLASAPAPISSPYIESIFHRYIEQLEADRVVEYIPPRNLPKYAQTNEMMLNAEDRVREISLYLWLSFKFPDYFPHTEQALNARVRLNNFIETSLQKGDFIKQCTKCGKTLDFTYKFSICDRCFAKRRRGKSY
jgi:ATP-dependent RNA helicase SUPV3L1/SUV3